NPFASCLPLLIQMPIMWGLYSAIRLYDYHFGEGYFLWVNPTVHRMFPDVVAPNLGRPDLLLLILYVISMFISQKLTPVDPQAEESARMMQVTMPLMFGVMMYVWGLPSAFIFYWLA